jgi:hypothetical protein
MILKDIIIVRTLRQYKVSGRFTVLLDASRADMDAAR